MKNRMAVILGATVCMATVSIQEAWAQNQPRKPFKVRCETDNMIPGAQVGRNGWAHRCGYISQAARDLNNTEGFYITFLEKVAPVDVNAPCEGFEGMTIIGWCAAEGCYTPNQRVMFGDRGYMSIENAGMSHVDTVSGFAQGWLPGDDIQLVNEKVGNYTVGDQFGGVFVIATKGGKRIEVTDKHPVVQDTGHVIPAKKIVAGKTQLLTVDGPELVASVQELPYVGKVWNVEPESKRVTANLHLAEGFVMGSVRFQNEWADDEYRRSLRDIVDVNGF